ncbi:hypothetical protein WJX72_006957 [[Myrmecia] bisecta]|uniref:HECT-type E3 ubiquitin transferase n=1 Tax=[Myrmecia] bisecta TaxID=41462 RepID=A0AAW1R767_9CHLO
MAVKAHKEVQLFKRVLTHDKFGDHVEEVRFEGPICLTGVKVGAAPGSAAQTGGSAHVSVFARDLSTLASARFACLTEQCSLPASGTKAVRLEPVFTDQVVLRGRYQTLPVALYGWTQQDTPQLQHLLPVTTLPSLTAIANAASSVIVCASPRHARRFMSVNGAAALAEGSYDAHEGEGYEQGGGEGEDVYGQFDEAEAHAGDANPQAEGPEEEVDYGDDDAEGHAAGHRGQPGWDEPDSAKPQDPERLEDMLADTPERLSDDDTKAKEQVAGMADAQAGADASKPSKSERERRRKDKSDSKHDSSRHPDERKGKDKDKKRDKEKSKDKDRDKDRERKRKDRDRDREKDRDSESRPRKSRRSHSKDRHASRADDEDGQRRKRARSRDRPTSRPSSRRSSREPEPLAHSSQAPSSSRDRSRGGQAGASAEPGGADALRSPRAGDRAVPLEPAVQSPSGRSASARAGPESSPAPLRGRDGPDKEAGRSENGPRAARERDKKLGRYDEYEGCYQALVDLMLERLPSQVTALGVKLLSRLRIYELAARFQAAADQLVQGHASEPRMATRDATLLCAQAGSALADLGDELAAQAEPRVERAKIVAACESSGGGVSLRPAGEPDGWALEALAGRRCLALLAAALHVPALHAAHLENSGALPPQTSAAAVQATLSQPLFSGVKALLSLLLSSSGGLSLISHEAAAAVCIISALDPNAAWYPDDVETNPDTSRAGPGAEMALTLQASLRALKAVERLPSFAAASLPALALLTQGEAGRHAVVAALCHQPGTLQWLVERLEAPIKPKPERGAADVPAAWHPDCMFAARLLLEVVRDPHPAILPRWLPSAEALKAAAAAALDKSEAQQAGGEVTKQELRELQARADSGASLAARGINALLQLLASLLPPSVASADPGQRRIREVDAKAAIQMFSATDKAGGVESGLDLLHALLVEPAGTFRAFAVLDADGLQVLERAVLTGLAGASASDADGLWAAFGGVALDDESLARNRARALRLLYSAASALSVLLQHMRCQDAEHSNAGCMRALLRAHACLCSTPESLAGMVGSVQGSDTRVVLQARQALAAGLKCWVESDLWAPDLIPTIFSGGKAASGEAASTVAQAPNEIFTSLCLLGDLFPGEWPPAGSARRGQHPPPSHMRYRAALARSFEPSAARFRRMISAAAASDSRIFRAALVRLCARAAGLGGGMGVFLAGPLIEQLKEAIATSAALAEVRRILEILVPLVYRPALKAAFLDLKLAGISARLLSRLVPVLNEGADAVALCTMVMELVTVLFNPDVCLNPALPPIERVLQECPPTAEAGLLVAVLLASLQRMGGNAHIAKRVLRQLANHAPGRAALRLGTAKWQVQAGAANPGADPNSHESMTWAADRLSELANSEAESEMDGMRAIMTEVAAVITEVSAQSQADEYDEPEEPPGAPARFAAAVQAAVSAGIAAGLNPTADTSRSELAESSSAAALVYDTATRVFWRNVKARSTTTTVPPLGRNPTRWEVSESVDPGTVASHIGEGLTEAKRSRDATLQAVAPGAASSQSVKQEKPPVKAKEEPAAAKPAFAADIPGADLPPVIAPPGRPRGRPAMLRGGPSAKSRPASMHMLQNPAGVAALLKDPVKLQKLLEQNPALLQKREQRRRQKLETKSATSIQAFWRSKRLLSVLRAQVRLGWLQQYGEFGERADSSCLAASSGYLRELLFFAKVETEGDALRLAAACRLILASQAQTGGLLFCQAAAAGSEPRLIIVHRAKRLARRALRALTLHRVALQRELATQRQGGAAQSPNLVPPLVEVLLTLTDANAWKPALGSTQASSMAADILTSLTAPSLFSSLSQLLLRAIPEPPPPPPTAAAAAAGPSQPTPSAAARAIPTAEALVTNLTIKFLALRQWPGMQAAGRDLPHLLCVPRLWDRCPTLRTVSGRVCRYAVEALHSLQPASALVAWLPGTLGPGKAAEAAALLGNLLEVGGAALKSEEASSNLEAAGKVAVLFASVAQLVLAVVPLRSLFPAASEDEEDGEEPVPSTSGRGAEALHWESRSPPAPLVAQYHRIAEEGLPALLKPLQLIEAAGLRQKVLISLAVSAELVQRMWFSYLKGAYAAGGEAWQPSGDASCDPGWMLPITVFCRVYSTFINTAGDAEMYRHQRPLPLSELYDPAAPSAGVLAMLKFAIWQALWVESAPLPGGWSAPAAALRAALKEAIGKLLGQLYDRNCRRAFAPADAFHVDSLPPERFHGEMQAALVASGGQTEALRSRVWSLLRHTPFLIPFAERARVFQTVVSGDRRHNREMEMAAMQFGTQHFVRIRRTNLLEDGFSQLNKLGDGLKSRIRIQFVDEYGMEEAGVDGGGLFKDFMESLVKHGFDPNVGLFKATSDNRLYPNPAAQQAAQDALAYFEFLGRMLGKALYEGILIELPLAGFFLKKFRNAYCDVNDLPTLDAELYRSLIFLRDYDGDVADLSLTFTVADSEFGEHREVELIPGGRDIAVTSDNRIEYIHRVANYRLNVQIRAASDAFRRGFHDLVQREWVAMFNEEELQMLISGGGEGLDITDLRQHVQYAGGYHAEHPIIIDFWKAMESFTPEQQAGWLKFVTACSRAPLLGFKYLEPQLCIQMAGSSLDPAAQERLPTSATCMNLLKLPPYQSPGLVRNKLLYAIKNVAGFDLS